MLQMSKGRNPSLAFDERFLKLISTLYLTRYFYSISCLNGRVGYSVCFKFCIDDCSYTLKKQRSKISQLEKVRFIKVNQLKLTQVELLSFFYFNSVVFNSFVKTFIWQFNLQLKIMLYLGQNDIK